MKYVIGLLALLLPLPALACGVLDHAMPRVGSSVKAPDSVELSFTQSIVLSASAVTVTDKNGKNVAQGTATSADKDHQTLRTGLTAPLAPGRYQVTWNVLWKDCGSKTAGDFSFIVE